jgi:DNA-binding MarR family transcriptional regulator
MKSYILVARITKLGNDMPISGQGDKWLQSFVPYLMYRITNSLNGRLRGQLRKAGINIARWRVLAVLRAYGELTLGRIVELTVMEQPSVSRIVTLLESERLVKRTVATTDARFVNVKLTAAGQTAFKQIYPAADTHQKRALRGFSKQEITTLNDFLLRIQDNIEADD